MSPRSTGAGKYYARVEGYSERTAQDRRHSALRTLFAGILSEKRYYDSYAVPRLV